MNRVCVVAVSPGGLYIYESPEAIMVSRRDHVRVIAVIFHERLKHRHKLAARTLTHFVRGSSTSIRASMILLFSPTVRCKALARPECLGLISRPVRIGSRRVEVWLHLGDGAIGELLRSSKLEVPVRGNIGGGSDDQEYLAYYFVFGQSLHVRLFGFRKILHDERVKAKEKAVAALASVRWYTTSGKR